MKRKSILSLSAALPIAALVAGTAFAHPPVASATTLPSTPARAVAASAAQSDYIIIIIITGEQQASSGIQSADKTAAAKSFDS